MKNYWIKTLRRLAAASIVASATAFSSAMSYAATIAFDTATDAAYDDGWQAGDNGGFGWGPWDFTGTLDSAVQQTVDIFSHPNDLGRAWTLYNPVAGEPGRPPGYFGDPAPGTDISQAGRSIGPLVPGDTVHLVIDNPTERRFFRGYTVRFNTGGGNTNPGDPPSSRLRVGTFEYSTNGLWFAADADTTAGAGDTTLFDTDTNSGMRIDFTLTGADTYRLAMVPLNNPSLAFTKTGTLDGSGPVDWIEFELYNTDSDYYPSPSIAGGETDFYVSNMWVTFVPEPSAAVLLVLGAGVMLGVSGRKREEG
jgi:hypothetical protein